MRESSLASAKSCRRVISAFRRFLISAFRGVAFFGARSIGGSGEPVAGHDKPGWLAIESGGPLRPGGDRLQRIGGDQAASAHRSLQVRRCRQAIGSHLLKLFRKYFGRVGAAPSVKSS